MSGTRRLGMLLAFLCAFNLAAQEKFQPRTAARAGEVRRYVVVLSAGSAPGAAKELALRYHGALQPLQAENFAGFAVSLTAGEAQTLSDDPQVASVLEEELGSAALTHGAASDMETSSPVPLAGGVLAPIATLQQATPANVVAGALAVAPPARTSSGLSGIATPETRDHTLAAPATAPTHRLSPGASRRMATDDTAIPPWQSGTYQYDGSGNITAIGTDAYTYDTMNRLVTSTTAGHTQNFDYDDQGNMKLATTDGVQAHQSFVTDSNGKTNNRLKAFWPNTSEPAPNVGYSGAGNVSTLGTSNYTWDPFNMMVTTSDGNASFLYDADDERIATLTAGTPYSYAYTLRGADQKVLRRVMDTVNGTTHSWQWQGDYIYRDGLLLAEDRPNTTFHFHLDHLGTPRLVTDANHHVIGRHTYWPFGVEIAGGQNEGEQLKFTGHESDIDTGDNARLYMHARYENPTMGRFLSVDPDLSLARALHQPQSWNRYAYVENNPLKFNDPTGKFIGFDDALELFAIAYMAISNPQVAQEISQGMIEAGETLAVLESLSQTADPKPVRGDRTGPGSGARPNKGTKDEIRERDNNKCVFCLKVTNTDKISNADKSEIDHSDPVKIGGNRSPGNLHNTCRTCNRQKGVMTAEQFLKFLASKGGEVAERASKILFDFTSSLLP